MSDQARVYLDLQGKSVPAGTAFFHHGRGQVSTTFTYDTEYLKKRQAYALDPALPLSPAPSTVTGPPGAFQDCSPDRRGRNLVQKEYRRLVQEGLARDRRLTEAEHEAEALMELASYCGLSAARAKEITAEVLDATSTWREVARYHGVSEAELTRFEQMFTAQKTSLQKVAGP